MKSLTPTLNKFFTIISLFSMCIPVSVLGLWIHSFNSGDNQADRVAVFNTWFPDFLTGRSGTTLLSMAFCAAAIILSTICLRVSDKIWKILNIIIMIISVPLFMINLFSMM
jgi:hypothetical protein